MARFADKTGREWELEFTVGMIPRLREAGLDLEKAETDETAAGVLFDLKTFGAVLWILVEEQAAGRSVTPEEFMKGINGPARFAAVEAMQAAYADFTQPPTVAKRINAKLPGVMETAYQRAADLTLSRLDGLNATAGSSPGSSAPTPPG